MPSNGPATDRTWMVRLLVCLTPLAFGAYALWVGQDSSWDLRNYHYYNPFAFLTGRLGYDVAVSHVATYYNPLMYIPFYWAVSSLPPKAIGFLLGVIPGLNMLILYGIARQVISLASPLRTAGLCLAAAAVGMLGQTVIAETGTSYGDTVVSLPVLAAVWLIMKYRERFAESVRRGWPVAAGAGLLVGAALGVKLPFAVYCGRRLCRVLRAAPAVPIAASGSPSSSGWGCWAGPRSRAASGWSKCGSATATRSSPTSTSSSTRRGAQSAPTGTSASSPSTCRCGCSSRSGSTSIPSASGRSPSATCVSPCSTSCWWRCWSAGCGPAAPAAPRPRARRPPHPAVPPSPDSSSSSWWCASSSG